MKNQKGITLIALVITIIVMLILVVVTINVATDGNLFTHAANAAKATNAHVQNEEAILNDELDKSIEDIVTEQTVTLIHFNINETEYTAEAGMTWRQWVNSKYNTGSFYIREGGTTVLFPGGSKCVNFAHLDQPIEENRTYLEGPGRE